MDKYYGIIALVIYIACLIAFIKYETKDGDLKKDTLSNVYKHESFPLDVNDEDALVASLVAAIECRNEYKKNVHIVSIRKVG